MNTIIIILLTTSLILLLLFLRQKEQRIQSLEKEVSNIFDRIIIMKFDLHGKILDVSDAYGNIFGYDKNELIGQTIDKSYISPSRLDKPIWQILQEEDEFQGEMQLFTADHQPYWMFKQIIKDYDRQNKHCGYVSISKDITADKAFEEQQKQLLDQSRHAIMGEMISMIAHQWKQPLATMTALTAGMHLDIQLKQVDDKILEENIVMMDQIIDHLAQTIEDFRNFFKNDKIQRTVTVKELVLEAIKLIEFKLSGIQITQSIDESFSIKLLKNELLQVLINIINNAADAMQESEKPHLDISLDIDSHHEKAIIRISDNGTGISEDIISKIFDPYFSTKSKNGTGLGLYICKTIVEKHLNGMLSVQSQKTGSQFIISIPYAKEHHE